MPLQPLPTAAAYTNDEVERRINIVRSYRERDLTPRSRIFLDLYEKTAELFLAENDLDKSARCQENLLLCDVYLAENTFMLRESTKEHREIRDMLVKLKEFEYYARYGDYFAYQTTKLRRVAEEKKLEGLGVLKQYWTKIAADLAQEEKLLQENRKVESWKIRTVLAVYEVATELGVNTDHAKTCISAYAARNELMHSTVQEMVQQGRFHELATMLADDEKELPLILPFDRADEKEALLTIIASIKDEFYEIPPPFSERPQLWNHSERARQVIGDPDLAEKRQHQLAKEAAAKTEAQHKKAQQTQAILKVARQDRRTKRHASSEIPESVKENLAQMTKKKAKVLKLEMELQKHEDILDGLYKKRNQALSELDANKT